MTRLRGRARRDQRLKARTPFGHWKTQTFIAALRCDGLTAPWVIDCPMNRATFETYVETQLAPTLNPGDVVILDNLSSHKSEKAKAILRHAVHGSSSPRLTALISTRSKWPSRNSKRICAAPVPEPSTLSGRQSATSATYTLLKNAPISSKQQDMRPIKGAML